MNNFPMLNGVSEDFYSNPRFKLPITKGKLFYCKQTNYIYELIEQIGSGAAAVVFKCRCLYPYSEHNKTYAVKIVNLANLKLNANSDKEKERIFREISILRSLSHPFIVNLIKVIETDSQLFLIMELVDGGELFYKIVELGSLSEDQARYIVVQVIQAVKYVHSKQVIHRDLKPENILIKEEVAPGFFNIKIADFGLAKLVVDGVTAAKTFVGTPQYWAPEVLSCSTNSNVTYGPEVDLWSLGCLIYVMLGGSYPFDSRLGPVDELIMNARYHFNYKRFQNVSESAKNLIKGLLTVNPKDRLTLEGVLSHPWLISYKVPYKLPDFLQLYPDSQHSCSSNFSNDRSSQTYSDNKNKLIVPNLIEETTSNESTRMIDFLRNSKLSFLQNTPVNRAIVPVHNTNKLSFDNFASNRQDYSESTENIFNFQDLLCIQLSSLKKFHWAYIALRHSPEAVKKTSQCIVEAQNIQLESISVIRHFENTCLNILDLIPDVSLAVSKQKIDLAVTLFKEMRVWISDLKAQMISHQEHNASFMCRVHDLSEEVQAAKLVIDKYLMKWLAYGMRTPESDLTNIIFSTNEDCTTYETLSNDIQESTITHNNSESSDVSNGSSCSSNVFTPANNKSKDSFNSAQSNDSSMEVEIMVENPVETKDNLNYFNSADNSTIKNNNHAVQSNSSVYQAHQRWYKALRQSILQLSDMNKQTSLLCNNYHPGHAVEDNAQDLVDVLLVPPQTQQIDFFQRQCSLNQKSKMQVPIVSDFSKTPSEVYHDTSTNNRQSTYSQQFSNIHLYKQTIKTAQILIKVLEDLRKIDVVLRKSVSFWLNMMSVIDRLIKMKLHTERLLEYTVDSVAFTARFRERLSEYSNFWLALKEQTHFYIEQSTKKLAALQDFVLALKSTADRLDTASAIHYGDMTETLAVPEKK